MRKYELPTPRGWDRPRAMARAVAESSAGRVARQEGVEAGGDIALLVATRDDDGDERTSGDHGRLPASTAGSRGAAGTAAVGWTKSPTIAPRKSSSRGEALTSRS